MRYWFKAKRYGYGWYPATKEGWLVMLIWVVFFAGGEVVFIKRITASGNPMEIAWLIPYILALTLFITWIAVKKGEPARWRWDRDDKE